MKVGGVQVTPPPEGLLVLEREHGNLVFRARPVPIEAWDHFNKLCPEPPVPMVLVKGEKKANPSDETYQHNVRRLSARRIAYLCLKSLEPSNIEWDSVKLDDPDTWEKFEDDLRAAGMTEIEIDKVIKLCVGANTLDEEKLRKARESFLRGQREA
jgi:hypothetical protein